MAIIEIRGLVKRFGAVAAVSELSFDVEQGSVTGFLGANGAGKTTTLRILLGLVAANAGTARINGRSYAELHHPLHHVGAALEASSFYPGRTARDHLRILALSAGVDPSRVDDVLGFVGLAGDAGRRVRGFSLGMRQRLALATALLCDPEILILDEPANGLDPEGVHWLRDVLRGFAAEGGTVLVSSHVLAEVAQTVDHVVIIDHGRLVRQAPLAELTAESTQGLQIRTPRAAELAGLINARGGAARVVADDRIEVTGTTSDQVGVMAAEHAIPIFETISEAAHLEDIFLGLTASNDQPR